MNFKTKSVLALAIFFTGAFLLWQIGLVSLACTRSNKTLCTFFARHGSLEACGWLAILSKESFLATKDPAFLYQYYKATQWGASYGDRGMAWRLDSIYQAPLPEGNELTFEQLTLKVAAEHQDEVALKLIHDKKLK